MEYQYTVNNYLRFVKLDLSGEKYERRRILYKSRMDYAAKDD